MDSTAASRSDKLGESGGSEVQGNEKVIAGIDKMLARIHESGRNAPVLARPEALNPIVIAAPIS